MSAPKLIASTELSGVAGWMVSLIDALGPAGVGVVIAIETIFPPIPSEAVLPAAGFLAATGRMSFWAAFVSATAGSAVGAVALYYLGAMIGTERIARLAERVPLMSRRDVDRAGDWFDRWQQPAVFFGRLIPGVRSLVSIPAGAQHMPLGRFVLLTTAGSAIWNLLLIGAGYWLGDRYGQTAAFSDWANRIVYVTIFGLIAWFIAAKIRASRSTDTVPS